MMALANSNEGLIGLENEFKLGADGWIKIAPYGDSIKERITRGPDGKPQQEVFSQQLDRAAAEGMARKFNSLWARAKRFATGVPIFREHPDLETYAPETITLENARGIRAKEPVPYGMFAGLEARSDGLYGKAVMTEQGRAAIEEDGLKWISPLWWVEPIDTRRGVTIVRPVELISAGLTKYPNIPGGEALANAKQELEKQIEEIENTMKKEQVIAALKKLGLALANEATLTDEQILQAFEGLTLKSGLTALENERTTLTQSKSQVESTLATEKSAKEKAEKELGETRTALANERKARIILAVDNAVLEGRITGAEKAKWTIDLEAAGAAGTLDGKLTALANEAVKVKTAALTANLGSRKGEADQGSDASQKVTALANARMKEHGEDWTTAFNTVRREHGALFDQMKQPAKQ